ncbi:DUF4279 domain-containing protein [Litoreibacter albidus]|uniref:DUF4279 domain-containing protein n=1 Tax=Litoreibacter albidus TaxID=670155 RepID=UPI001FCD22F8|nr:DUF4279 domain-containing protein [Litoreibacter albidus]
MANYFDVELLIRHPKLSADEITKTLDLTPDVSFNVGEQRVTPVGTTLDGKYRHSSWSLSWQFVSEKRFFACVESVLNKLKPKQSFFVQIAEEGGKTMLNLKLYGRVHSGDVGTMKLIEALKQMEILLGLEVFPDWDEAEESLNTLARQAQKMN